MHNICDAGPWKEKKVYIWTHGHDGERVKHS